MTEFNFDTVFDETMQTHNLDTVVILGHLNPDGDAAGSVMSLAPVSYTHLDVYKRQDYDTILFSGYIRHLKRNKYLIFHDHLFRTSLQRFCKVWKHPVLWIIDMDIVRKAHHRSGSIAIRI